MALYYFDFTDRTGTYVDNEGSDLADESQLEQEAARALAEMFCDRLSLEADALMLIKVRDAAGLHILEVSLALNIKHF